MLGDGGPSRRGTAPFGKQEIVQIDCVDRGDPLRGCFFAPCSEHEDMDEVLLNHSRLNRENATEVAEHVFVHPSLPVRGLARVSAPRLRAPPVAG